MDSQWLKIQFDLNPERTKAGLAGHIGLEPPAISKILNGTRQIKAQEYIKMREYFGLPTDTVGGPRHSPQPVKARPKLATSQETGFSEIAGHASSGENWAMPSQLHRLSGHPLPLNIKIFQVSDDLMNPEFSAGEYILADLSDDTPYERATYVLYDGFTYLVRHCEAAPNSSPAQLLLSANAKGFQPQNIKQDDIDVVGRVVAKLKML